MAVMNWSIQEKRNTKAVTKKIGKTVLKQKAKLHYGQFGHQN